MRAFAIASGLAAVLATGGLWLYTHISPEQFGSCHSVALYRGPKPTIRDCQPYEAADFAVPLALIAVFVPLMLFVTGDMEAEIPVPFIGARVVITRRGRQAEAELAESVSDLDQRGEEWLETLVGSEEQARNEAGGGV